MDWEIEQEDFFCYEYSEALLGFCGFFFHGNWNLIPTGWAGMGWGDQAFRVSETDVVLK